MKFSQIQLQQQVQAQSAITGFCYAFAKLLLDRLHAARVDEKLFYLPEDGGNPTLTPLAANLVFYLDNQIPKVYWDKISHINYNREYWLNNTDVCTAEHNKIAKAIIAQGYDFLATFEPK